MPKLPNAQFRAMVPLLREKGFYAAEIPRAIAWAAYTETEVDDAYETLLFIRDQVDAAAYLPMPGKRGKPLTDPKVLAKAVLVCEALGLTERQAQGWLKIIGPFVGITQPLDDRTIGDAYDKLEVIYLLKQVFDAGDLLGFFDAMNRIIFNLPNPLSSNAVFLAD